MDKYSALKKILLFYNRNTELLKLVRSTFDSRIAVLQNRKRKNLILLECLKKQQLLLLAVLEDNTNNRVIRKLNRQSAFWEVSCNCMDDQFFKNHFRMTRASFNVLCGYLSNLNKVDTKWRKAIPLQKRVAIALFTLSSFGEYRVVSALFGVGKSTICYILAEFCEEVWNALSSEFIKKLPPTPELVTECVDGFRRLGFPQCLGAIDGCHIEIKPSANDATDYYNNKGWYSVVLLALVDYRCRFLYVNIGAPGHCTNSKIYNSSRLKKLLAENEVLAAKKKDIGGTQMPICILGDSAFQFSTTLMKPYAFSTTLSDNQKLFNYRLSKCRRVVENTFGQLKARFRRIGKRIENRNGNASKIIRTCCVLHNFLNERNDTFNQIWLEDVQDLERNRKSPTYNDTVDDNEPTAEVIRQGLCCYFNSEPDADLLVSSSDETGGSGVEDPASGVLGDGSNGVMEQSVELEISF